MSLKRDFPNFLTIPLLTNKVGKSVYIVLLIECKILMTRNQAFLELQQGITGKWFKINHFHTLHTNAM